MEKKIVQLCKFGPNYKGGIEVEAENITRILGARGVTLEMLHFSSQYDSPKDIFSHNLRRKICKTNFQFKQQPISFSYFKEVLKLSKNSVIHLHLPNYWGIFSCLFIAHRTKVILHWHSDVVGSRILRFILKPIEIFILYKASTIICTSVAYAKSSKDLQNFMDKVRVLPIATECRHGASAHKQLGGIINVLNVGRLVNYKNQKFLVEVFNLLPKKYKLNIVGDGPLHNDLQKTVKQLNMSNRVNIIRGLTDDELQKEYLSADLFVLSSNSRAEAFGIVLIEALSFGLPIVALKIPGSGVNTVNCEGLTGFNTPIGCRLGMARRIVELTQSTETYNVFKRKAVKYHQENYSFQAYERNLEDIYSKLL